MRRIIICLIAAIFLFTPDLHAADRLRLLDTWQEKDSSSNPVNFKKVGNLLYFNANGSEIWVTDGTEAGTRKTPWTGTIDSSYYASGTTLYRYKCSSAYWMPSLAEYKDGPEGPLQATLIEIQCDSSPRADSIIEFKGEIYFQANYGQTSGVELIACKRGETNTFRMVADIYPGMNSSTPYNFRLCDGRLFFTALSQSHGLYGREMSSTDGITVRKDVSVIPTLAPDGPANITVAGHVIYCTERVKDLLTPSYFYQLTPRTSAIGGSGLRLFSTCPSLLTEKGSALFFVAEDETGKNVWRTNEDLNSVHRICDVNPNSSSESATRLTVSGENLFFLGQGDGTGTELWRIDADNQAALVKDLSPGATSTTFRMMGDLNGTFYFAAKTEPGGWGLWKTDGRPEGTILVTSLANEDYWDGSQTYRSAGSINGRLVFPAVDPIYSLEPFLSDGTAAGTHLLTNAGRTVRRAMMLPIGTLNDSLFFFGRTDVHQQSVGSVQLSGRAKMVSSFFAMDLRAFSTSFANNSRPSAVRTAQKLFFPIDGSVYAVDESAAGMERLFGNPRWEPFSIGRADVVNGMTYHHELAYQLPAKTDGTKAGTVLYQDLVPFKNYNKTMLLGIVGNNAFMPGYQPETGEELWVSNGKPAGSKLVKDINPGTASSNLSNGAMCGNYVYFSATTPEYGAELWRSNGSETGTRLVKDIVPGTGDSAPRCLGPAGDVMIFAAYESSTGLELWRTNGTAATTYLLKDLRPGSPSYYYFNFLCAHQGLAYIIASTAESGGSQELWRTDGTADGTIRLAHYTSGTDWCRFIGTLGDRVVFAEPTGKIASTDGTSCTEISSSTARVFLSERYCYQVTGQSGESFYYLRSDGTPENTRLYSAPLQGTDPAYLGLLKGEMILATRNTGPSQSIWSYDLLEDSAVNSAVWHEYK